jgi:predicted NUDIX family phosphoesterase
MVQEEQVLVIDRKVIERVGMFNGLVFDTDRYLREIFVPGIPRFMNRSEAETDPGCKQLIPYIIMCYDGKYLSYVRGKRAGETRLVGNRSIGIGGHINPSDDMSLFDTGFYETYLAAANREVAEEVSVDTTHTNHIVSLLNDDSNEVGSVHLGIVHYWALDAPSVNKREQMITRMDFMTPSEIKDIKDTLETWSAICVEHLPEMENRIKTAPEAGELFKKGDM